MPAFSICSIYSVSFSYVSPCYQKNVQILFTASMSKYSPSLRKIAVGVPCLYEVYNYIACDILPQVSRIPFYSNLFVIEMIVGKDTSVFLQHTFIPDIFSDCEIDKLRRNQTVYIFIIDL